jgi:hypothetical protein
MLDATEVDKGEKVLLISDKCSKCISTSHMSTTSPQPRIRIRMSSVALSLGIT